MKSLLIIGSMVVLTGCTSFLPVKQKFPEPVKELTEPCPDLKMIEGNQVAITELLKTVVNNYALYYQCSNKNEGWNKWYEEQKKIYDKVK